QAVIRDDRHAVLDRLRDRRLDGGAVLGKDDQHLRALRDQVVDVTCLSLSRRLRVVRDVLPAAGGDRCLDRGLVPLGPALLLIVVPGDADRAGRCRRSRGAAAAASPSSSTARRYDKCGRCRDNNYARPHPQILPPREAWAARLPGVTVSPST